MQIDNRKYNKGTLGNKGGRKPKAEEQRLIETLEPMHPIALDALKKALDDRQSWAVKLFFEYFYGKPTTVVDLNTTEVLQQPILSINPLIDYD
jgi:hypothetical protein